MSIDTLISPQDSCDRILHAIKYSNLTFSLQETPYSVYLTIRKKFLKEAPLKVSNQDKLEHEILRLKDVNNLLQNDLAEEIDNHSDSQNIIKLLEDKLEHIEAEVMKQCKKFKTDKEDLEVEARELKAAIKNDNDVSAKNLVELSVALKATKACKDKISNLENNQRKLEEKVQELENKNNQLKAANKKIQKNHKIKPRLVKETEQLKIGNDEDDESAELDQINMEKKFEYKVETNNNFEVLAKHNLPDKHALKKGDEDSSAKKTYSKNPTDTRLFVDGSNWRISFKEFLDTFEDKGLKEPKYILRAREMTNNKYNTMHIRLKDIRKFNPTLADFLFKEQFNMYSDICLILKSFFEEHNIEDSTRQIFFSLICS